MKGLFLILIITLFSSIKSDIYQTIIHQGYVMATDSTTDYHKFQILLHATTFATDPAANTYVYAIKRQFVSSAVTVNSELNNSVTLNSRYKSYIMDFDGVLNTKNYVAYDITPSCASNLITVDFKVKYFNCELLASDFYDSLATSNNKAYFNKYGLLQTTQQSFQATNTNNSKFIAKDQTTVDLC